MINLNNTKIAFHYKNTYQLKKARIMFRLVARSWVVKLSKWATSFALFFRIPLRPFVKPTIFSQFCGGETIDECDKVVNKIGEYNVGSILDYSVEGAENKRAHKKTAENILATIEKAAGNPKIPFAVFKVTGIARDSFLERVNDQINDVPEKEQDEYEEVYDRIKSICQRAFDLRVPIFIDAEDYSMQNAIDHFAWEMMLKFNNEKAVVFNTIQAYRVDRFDFLKNQHKRALKKNMVSNS